MAERNGLKGNSFKFLKFNTVVLDDHEAMCSKFFWNMALNLEFSTHLNY